MILSSEKILQLVNNCLEQMPYNREPKSLYEPIQYVLSMGGKRIRPVLMLLSYNLFRDNPESILMPACALETYHNYTLLHDDLMDHADLRRGHETVHKKWDPAKLKEVLDIFTETALQIGEGQEYDMTFEQRTDVCEEEYIEMIRLKTSVLLACATKIGAVLADASEEDAQLLYKFGEQMGLAFQLQDDYLDVYGDPAVFGKAIGGDITSNKKTYMLINAYNKANDEQRQELMRWMTVKEFDRQEKIQAVTRLYNEIGIDQMAKARIEYYFGESRKYLAAVHVDDERKQELIAYTNEMMKRKK